MPTNGFSGVFRASYTSTVPFTETSYDADDLAKVTYLPLDSSGKFSEIPFKVFTVRQCQPLVIQGGAQALTSLDSSFRNIFNLSLYPNCSKITVYRPLAITWNSRYPLK